MALVKYRVADADHLLSAAAQVRKAASRFDQEIESVLTLGVGTMTQWSVSSILTWLRADAEVNGYVTPTDRIGYDALFAACAKMEEEVKHAKKVIGGCLSKLMAQTRRLRRKREEGERLLRGMPVKDDPPPPPEAKKYPRKRRRIQVVKVEA